MKRYLPLTSSSDGTTRHRPNKFGAVSAAASFALGLLLVFFTFSCTKESTLTVTNSILPTDFSDPDVIRVGDKYYMTCSEFHYMGMPVMESADLVHWRVIAQIYDSIPLPGYGSMERYGQGTWAPTIRHHDGKFWIFVCTPNDGLFMTTAERPEGPWAPLYCVKEVRGWEDPCPFWDEDGQAYLGHSVLGAGPIIVHKMAPDGSRLLDDGQVVYTGPVAEGTKFLKRDGWYYLSIPEGGVGTGWQMALRSKSIYGPYEGKRVLEQGSTAVNGPHQGALVDTPDGQWWFFHFQDTQPLGRIVHLQPVIWQDGFPLIGVDRDGNGVGEPVDTLVVPVSKSSQQFFAAHRHEGGWIGEPVTSFTDLQWQWNHNPRLAYAEVTPSCLALKALPADKVRQALNQYTLKTYGRKDVVTVSLDFSDMQSGQRAGLECIGRHFIALGVEMKEENDVLIPYLYIEKDGETDYIGQLEGRSVILQLDVDNEANCHQFAYAYAENDAAPQPCGAAFDQFSGDWKGSRLGLYTYQSPDSLGQFVASSGTARFTQFCYQPEK